MKAPLFKPAGMSDAKFRRLVEREVRGLTPDQMERWLDEREKAMGIVGLWKTIRFTPEAAELFKREFGVSVEEFQRSAK
jgi:hypothetical protein